MIKSGTDSPEVVDVPVTGFAGSRDLSVECKVGVQECAFKSAFQKIGVQTALTCPLIAE